MPTAEWFSFHEMRKLEDGMGEDGATREQPGSNVVQGQLAKQQF